MQELIITFSKHRRPKMQKDPEPTKWVSIRLGFGYEKSNIVYTIYTVYIICIEMEVVVWLLKQ